MSRWDRARWPLAGGLVAVGGALVWWVYHLQPAARSDTIGFGGFVLGLVGVLIAVLRWLGIERRRSGHRSVDTLAALLAQAMYEQWNKAARERRLLTPAPIPVSWSLGALGVAGPAAAVGPPGAAPAFRPLPGHPASTEADLYAGGGRRELHALYSGLPSGRVVVVGEPGAGKTGAAILLLLDALEHRDLLDGAARARCPVPVLFTTHGWDPNVCSVRDWLATRLVADYPLFSGRSGVAEASALLDAQDTVALILDGFDEMAPELHPAALQALSDAPFRLVVLTRCPELTKAATRQWLVGAATVRLHNVTALDAADYLHRARAGPPPTRWADLLTHLREHPDSTLAQGLSNPLALTLVRDTYQPGDDIGKLLDTPYREPEAVEHHLITRVLPAAYTPRAGHPPPRYSLAQAHQTLSFIAHRLKQDETRDLAWWHIPGWTSRTPRILVTGLTTGLVFGLVAGLVEGFAAEFRAGLTVGLATGLAAGLAAALAAGLAAWIAAEREEVKPQRIRAVNWRAVLSWQVFAKALVVGLPAGLCVGLAAGRALGLATGLATWLTVVLMGRFIDHSPEESSPLDPRETWRNDRIAGLAAGFQGKLMGKFTGLLAGLRTVGLAGIPRAGLAVGLLGLLVVAFVVALAGAFEVGPVFGVTASLAVGLTGLLAIGVAGTATWATTLAWHQLRISGRVSAVSLMPFLEDARKRGVLRTVGPIYQFRHATLQDQLANQATSSSPPISTVARRA